MNKARCVFINFNSRLHQRRISGLSDQMNIPFVRNMRRNQPNINTSLRRHHQRRQQLMINNQIRRGHPHIILRLIQNVHIYGFAGHLMIERNIGVGLDIAAAWPDL